MGLAAGLAMVVCQTVTGVAQIELSVDSLVFNPTTIDSLSVMEVTVSNALSVAQQVTLTGFSAPFSTLENPLTVPAEGSTMATFHFNPTSVSTFTNEVANAQVAVLAPFVSKQCRALGCPSNLVTSRKRIGLTTVTVAWAANYFRVTQLVG